MEGKRPFVTKKRCEGEGQIEYYGNGKEHDGCFIPRPKVTCASRIIIRPRTVRIDMFKYYTPILPK